LLLFSQSIHLIRFHFRLSTDSVELCACTSDRERSTRAGEACTSDRQHVNPNSYSCLCELRLVLVFMWMWPQSLYFWKHTKLLQGQVSSPSVTLFSALSFVLCQGWDPGVYPKAAFESPLKAMK